MIDRIQYGYDPAGNRTWRRNLAAEEEGGQDNAYRYDGLYQVKESALGTLNLNRSAIGAIPAEEEAFAYDPSGNWTHFTQKAGGATTLDQSRVSNRDNQMTQIDGSSDGIAYDRAGNATHLPPDADGQWDSSHRLIWDGWNRLVEVRDSTGATVAKYAYDGLHRRTTKTLGTETRHFYYNDQWKCVEERVEHSASSSSSSSSSSPSSSSSSSTSSSSGPSTAAAVQYVWGARPGHRDELILRDRDPGGGGTLTERLYATMDYFNGTSILDTEGTVQERYGYSAFGVRRVMAPDFSTRSSSDFDWEFGFQGQFLDLETGWMNYGYRYYVPWLGRWPNRDPIGEEGGVNVYAFVGNDGVSKLDRFGLLSIIVNKPHQDVGFCGVYVQLYHLSLDGPAPCDGYLVQKVTFDSAIWGCSGGNCDEGNELSPPLTGAFWEAWYISKGSTEWAGQKILNPAHTDKARRFNPLSFPCCGKTVSEGEIRFYCLGPPWRNPTGDLGDLRIENGMYVPRSPTAQGWKLGTDFPDDNPASQAGSLPATDKMPDFWNGTSVATPATRSVTAEFDCCSGESETKLTVK